MGPPKVDPWGASRWRTIILPAFGGPFCYLLPTTPILAAVRILRGPERRPTLSRSGRAFRVRSRHDIPGIRDRRHLRTCSVELGIVRGPHLCRSQCGILSLNPRRYRLGVVDIVVLAAAALLVAVSVDPTVVKRKKNLWKNVS